MAVLQAAVVSVLAAETSPVRPWLVVSYKREIDLSRAFPVEVSVLSMKNISPNPQSHYDLLLNLPDNVPTPAMVEVSAGKKSLPYEVLAPNRIRVSFDVPVAVNSVTRIAARFMYVAPLEPAPAKIALADQQFLMWSGNKLAALLYPIKEYTLLFTGITQGLEYDVPKPLLKKAAEAVAKFTARVDGASLVYGPLADPIIDEPVPMILRYDHAKPVVHAHAYNRSVWIPASSLANVVIEEQYDLAHVGAGLKDGFSRVEWMTGRYAMQKSHWLLLWIDFHPLEDDQSWSDANYYHSDLVGKVSTPGVHDEHLILQPRFPLFGGWRYNFTLSYEPKLASVVHRVTAKDANVPADTFIAKVPVVNTATDITYGKVRLSFYLPEGAKLLNVSTNAYGLAPAVERDTERSFWDVGAGHTKVTITFNNITSASAVDLVYITYQYTTVQYLRKMLTIAGSVFIALTAYYGLGIVSIDIQA